MLVPSVEIQRADYFCDAYTWCCVFTPCVEVIVAGKVQGIFHRTQIIFSANLHARDMSVVHQVIF